MDIQNTDHQRLANWNMAMQQVCGRFETEIASHHTLFIGEVNAFSRAGLSLASLRTNASNIRRLGENPALDDDQYCFLVIQRAGHATVEQDGMVVGLAPGEVILMDSIGRCEIKPNGLIEHIALALPREQVRKRVQGKRILFGKISSTSACGRMLHVLMDQLCKEGISGDDCAHGDALQTALIALLEPAFELSADTRCNIAALSTRNLRGYVQRIIDESLSQPNLTPALLAARLNISVRHLYRLFEGEGDSVCRYIQRTRLQRSADDLASPFCKAESITSIAYKWGFTDSSHFSRAFKKQYEQSPKNYRARAFT